VFATHYRIAGLEISTYALFVVVAIAVSAGFYYRKSRADGLRLSEVACVLATALLFAQFGAVLSAWFESADRLSSLPAIKSVAMGTAFGSNFLGGVLGGSVGFAIALKLLRRPLLAGFDAAAPALMLGVAIGRLGCFFSVDGCYGTPSDLPWAMTFPAGLLPTQTPVHPTPLYESILALATFFCVARIVRRAISHGERPEGLSVLLTMISYASWRFLIEFVRRNPHWAWFTEAQWICIALGIGATAAMFRNSQAMPAPVTRLVRAFRPSRHTIINRETRAVHSSA
jgi:phosphatidylglycerol:prolipoprotein diacylglycerol transferase